MLIRYTGTALVPSHFCDFGASDRVEGVKIGVDVCEGHRHIRYVYTSTVRTPWIYKSEFMVNRNSLSSITHELDFKKGTWSVKGADKETIRSSTNAMNMR